MAINFSKSFLQSCMTKIVIKKMIFFFERCKILWCESKKRWKLALKDWCWTYCMSCGVTNITSLWKEKWWKRVLKVCLSSKVISCSPEMLIYVCLWKIILSSFLLSLLSSFLPVYTLILNKSSCYLIMQLKMNFS